MQTDFSGDPRPIKHDTIIEEAAIERAGKAIRIRFQPLVFRLDRARGGQYQAWKEVRWTVECDTPAEAFALRDALRAFFAALGRGGAGAVIAALTGVVAEPADAELPAAELAGAGKVATP
jgi:hypothetical protein